MSNVSTLLQLFFWVTMLVVLTTGTGPRSVFRVFPVLGNIGSNMAQCRAVCTDWKQDAYVATIMTNMENEDVANQTQGMIKVLLGGQRDTTSSPFWWTEGPLGRVNTSRGVVVWTGGAANSNGRCTVGMYCNFHGDFPNQRSGEHLLVMFGFERASSHPPGQWSDESPNGTGTDQINGCACRWDPVAFSVFPVAPTDVSLQYCRWCCATWRPGGYVATILSAEENAMVYALLWSNWTFVALGATRQPDGSSEELLQFRWTEGPLGAANGGIGTLLWRRREATWNGIGECATGMYCNFAPTHPENGGGNQVQVVISAAAMTAQASQWDDRRYTGAANTSFEGCACRWDLTSLSETSSPSSLATLHVTPTRTGTSSGSPSKTMFLSSYSSTNSWGLSRTTTVTPRTMSPSLLHGATLSNTQSHTPSLTSLETHGRLKRYGRGTASPSWTGSRLSRSHSWSLVARTPTVTTVAELPTSGWDKRAHVFTVTAVVVSAATGGLGANSASLLLLSVLSCSAAAPPSPITAYMISPLFYMGNRWIAWGNLLLTCAFAAVHACITVVAARRDGPSFVAAATGFYRFPALSIQCADFLLPGAVHGAVRLLASPASDATAGVSGGAVVLLCGVFAAASVLLTVQRVLPQCQWEPYDMYPRTWDAALFPSGRWAPLGMRNSVGPLMTLMVYRWGWLSAGQRLLTLLLSVVTGLQGNSLCSAALLLLAMLNACAGALYVGLQCHRLPMNRVVVPAAHAVFAVVCVQKFVSVSNDGGSYSAGLSVTQPLYVALLVWGAVSSLWVSYREAQWTRCVAVCNDVLHVSDVATAVWFGGGGFASRKSRDGVLVIGESSDTEELCSLPVDALAPLQLAHAPPEEHDSSPTYEDHQQKALCAADGGSCGIGDLPDINQTEDQVVLLSDAAPVLLQETEPVVDHTPGREFCGIDEYFYSATECDFVEA